MPWLRPMVQCVLVLEGAALQHREERVEIAEQELGRLLAAAPRRQVSSTSLEVMP